MFILGKPICQSLLTICKAALEDSIQDCLPLELAVFWAGWEAKQGWGQGYKVVWFLFMGAECQGTAETPTVGSVP